MSNGVSVGSMVLDFEGVYVPVVTPFDRDGDVDPTALAAVVERCLDAGVRGIVSCGTTGEYYALSDAERIDVMRHTHTFAAGRAQLVAGCNSGCHPARRSRSPAPHATSATTR